MQKVRGLQQQIYHIKNNWTYRSFFRLSLRQSEEYWKFLNDIFIVVERHFFFWMALEVYSEIIQFLQIVKKNNEYNSRSSIITDNDQS